MMLSIPTGIDLRAPTEKRANLGNCFRRLDALRFMRKVGIRILGDAA
jgi:hypothetical protein